MGVGALAGGGQAEGCGRAALEGAGSGQRRRCAGPAGTLCSGLQSGDGYQGRRPLHRLCR